MKQAMVPSSETDRMPIHASRVVGIDFSGAASAGNSIWIAIGSIVGNKLRLEDCYPAKDLPESSANRDICLPALRHFLAAQGACLCGMDFPFGLPRELVKESSWEEFVLYFGDRYQSPEHFKEACLAAANGRERRRVTDEESKTPFSSYNLRLFRQTYFGIRDLLAPLVKETFACILPMQQPLQGKPWIVEVCPASTLKKLDLYKDYHYKGTKNENRDARAKILCRLEAVGGLLIPTKALQSKILEGKGGDALDCVIAAIATFRSRHNLMDSRPMRTPYALEGYVYA